MNRRSFSLADRLLGEIDKAIKVLAAPACPQRAVPGTPGVALEPQQSLESGRLMRVNHAGEVAAQALYRGQALTARRPEVADAMRVAADEELDHLAWCETRIKELKGRTSLLNPFWYVGSFAIGALAGLSGDGTSLGFITETERQVESHLRGHLDRLPAADGRSRAIVEQMTHDEMKHGRHAAALGGREPPLWIKGAMRLASKVMTGGSRWI